MSLPEALVASGLAVLAGGVAVNIMADSVGWKLGSDVYEALAKYRANVISSLRSSDALARMGEASVNNVPCLKTRQNCSAASTAYAELIVVDRAGTRLTERDSMPNVGFDVRGVTCVSYPSEQCPFRFETKWRSLCDGASCASPQLQVRGELKIWNEYTVPLNRDLFGFEITLGQFIGSYEQACTSIGGVYLAGEPPRCQLSMTGDCQTDPDGKPWAVYAFNRTTKTKICAPIYQWFANRTPCAPGQVMRGTDGTGTPICRDIVQPTCTDPSDPTCRPFPCQLPDPPAECGNQTQLRIPVPDPVDPPSGGDGGGDGGCGDGGGGGGDC